MCNIDLKCTHPVNVGLISVHRPYFGPVHPYFGDMTSVRDSPMAQKNINRGE